MMDNVHLLPNMSAVIDCGSFLGTSDTSGNGGTAGFGDTGDAAGGALFFYAQPVTFFSDTCNYTISSRQIVIGPLEMLPVIAMTTESDRPSAMETKALNAIVSDKRLAVVAELVIVTILYV